MKKYLAALALAAPVPFAYAASANTINFQGEVTDQTCEVSINGATSSPTVLLPAVSAASLATAGSTSPSVTTFTIGVSGCRAPESAAQAIKTVFVGNQTTGNGNLANTGTAGNVALQLLDPANPSVGFDLNTAGGYAATGLNLAAGATAATYDFAVRYISEAGTATAGSVRSSVQYQLSYQ